MAKKNIHYTHEEKLYMADHYGKLSSEVLTEYFRLKNADCLRKLASRFRIEGYPVPMLPRGEAKIEPGTRSVIKHGRYTYDAVKAEPGWKQVPKKMRRPHKPRQKAKQIEGRPLKPAKPKKATFKTRVDDLSTKVPVFIPALRAVVYASAGCDKEQIKRKYMQQHARQLGAVKQ